MPRRPSPSEPAPGPRANGEVWIGIATSTGGLYGSSSSSIAYLVMFDDGTVVRKLPPVGADAIDLPALRGWLTDMVGTYRVRGNRLDMQFGTYHTAFERRGDGALVAVEGMQSTYVPADSLDGAVLDGAYGVGTSSGITFQFTRDGRFASAGDNLLLFDESGRDMPVPAGTGHYRIAHNTLTLTFDSGVVVRIAIVTTTGREGFPRPERILLNTFAYVPR